VASLSQGRTAAAQCGLFTYKSVPVIFEPPCKILSYSMEQSRSLEANRFQVVKKFPALHGTRTFITAFTSAPHLFPILSQLDLAHTPISYFLKIHFNIIIPSNPGSPKWSLSLSFPHQNPVYASLLTHTRYMPRQSHSSRFYHLNNIG